MEQGTISMQEIFLYEKQGVDENGKVLGRFRPTGIRPRFLQQMLASGIKLPADIFNP
jgi:pilus assembly protein CpaF